MMQRTESTEMYLSFDGQTESFKQKLNTRDDTMDEKSYDQQFYSVFESQKPIQIKVTQNVSFAWNRSQAQHGSEISGPEAFALTPQIGKLPSQSTNHSLLRCIKQYKRSASAEELTQQKKVVLQTQQTLQIKLGFNLTLVTKPLLLKEGYVQKLSEKRLVGWQKRFFQLYEGKLLYFKDQAQRHRINGCISLINYNCSARQHKDHIELHLEGIKRVFVFKTNDPHWYQQLKEQLVVVRELQNDKRIPILKLEWRKKYLKQDIISETEFLNQSETGDLLLVKKIRYGFLSQWFSSNSFDLCFLVYKETGETYLVSQDQKGLILIRFQQLMDKLQGQIDIVSIRRLHYINKSTMQLNFLEDVAAEIKPDKHNTSAFCDNSQSILNFYKKIGVLRKCATLSNTQLTKLNADQFPTQNGSWFSHLITVYPERHQETVRFSYDF